ncbi:MAG: threonine synthase [Actinomycetota bacterium]
MANQWQGVLREWADVLDVTDASTVVTLGEGGTPLIESRALSAMTDARVLVKFEGLNPTGSFKDRGMTVAVSRAIERGATAVACASTGNTSASAAAYAAAAGIQAVVLVPEGRISMGKLAQSVVHGARIVQIRGNFDDCLDISKELAERYPVHLVNSVNDDRIEGQKTAALEIIDVLGDAPDIHIMPVGNAGNITSYWRGFSQAETAGAATRRPRMLGFQAAGAAPIVRGEVVRDPDTVATAIRIGNPASWQQALDARDESGGHIGAIEDADILRAQRLLASSTGVFVEPASAISVAGLLERHAAGEIPAGSTVTLTVTGHGLKDAAWGLRLEDGSDATPESADADTAQVAQMLGLA